MKGRSFKYLTMALFVSASLLTACGGGGGTPAAVDTTAPTAPSSGTQHSYNLDNNQTPADLTLVSYRRGGNATGTASLTGGQLVTTPVDTSGYLETNYSVSGATRIRAKAKATIGYSLWGISAGIEFVDALGNTVLYAYNAMDGYNSNPQRLLAGDWGTFFQLPALGSYNIELIADANQIVANVYDLNNKLLGSITPTYLNGKTFADIEKVRFRADTTSDSNASIDDLLVDTGGI